MSLKLRELIRAVRAAKTAAEERAVITNECALCRTAFAAGDTKNRHRNVAKLLYIHMLGYPTHFAQMEALKLVSSNSFSEKRIGYLALMLLLDERNTVMMLVTNSLKKDFQDKNVYAIGLALVSIGNVASADMSRDLANEIEGFFRHSNPYLRKKACLAAVRCIRKVPDLVEDFVAGASSLLTDRFPSVQLTAVTLVIEMCKIQPAVIEQFRKMVKTLVKILAAVRAKVNDFDGSSGPDPFLQCRIMHLLRLLGKGDAEASEAMNEVLAQVAVHTEASKNPGFAVLYECVMTIMNIEAEGGLRTVAINILGRFLVNQNNNNIRYVALSTLCQLVEKDTLSIQRHRNTIVDCLKDADISIRRRALDLIYALVTKANVVALVKELLNYLVSTTGDVEFKTDLTEKICVVIERFAPDTRWHVDTVIEVLSTAGEIAQPHVATDLITLVSQSESMYAYAVHKLFETIQKLTVPQLQVSIVAVWAIGEFGELLVSVQGTQAANIADDVKFQPVTEAKVLEALSKVSAAHSELLLKQYMLNALIKLTTRFSSVESGIQSMIATYSSSLNVDVQQRAVEYAMLCKQANMRVRVLARMPKMESRVKSKDLEVSSEEDGSDDESGDEKETVNTAKPQATPSVPAVVVPSPAPVTDLMDIFGVGAAPAPAPTASPVPPPQVTPQPQAADVLASIFGGPLQPTPAPQPLATTTLPIQNNNLDSIFGGGFTTPAPAPTQQFLIFPSQMVYQSQVLTMHLSHSVNPASLDVCETKASFSNNTAFILTGFEFQVAVPKFLKNQMEPPSSTVLPVGGNITQVFSLTNSMHGQKRLVIKVRINYVLNGQSLNEQLTFDKFPEY
jgi:AP-1 complex subunit gamma-1